MQRRLEKGSRPPANPKIENGTASLLPGPETLTKLNPFLRGFCKHFMNKNNVLGVLSESGNIEEISIINATATGTVSVIFSQGIRLAYCLC